MVWVDRIVHESVGLGAALSAEGGDGVGEVPADEGHGESAVASAGAVADDGALDEDDVEVWSGGFEFVGGGQAGEAAADDGDVAIEVFLKRGSGDHVDGFVPVADGLVGAGWGDGRADGGERAVVGLQSHGLLS